MVNTGKASNACAICKQRRIKCDLVQPKCSQCAKSGWDCPGPRTESDVIFKDQNEIAMRNASRGRTVTNQSIDSRSQSRATSYSLSRTVSPSTFDCGTTFFMRQYIFPGVQSSDSSKCRGHHEYLPALLSGEETSGPLRTIVAAAGLAALSNAGNASTWIAESYQLYNKAIRQMKSALQDPVEAGQDGTLAAIMLMGTFEAIVSGDVNSMKFYGGHTMAAARCLELRGPAQFRDNTQVKLFLELRRVIFMTCHQLQTTIPCAVSRWSSWAEQLQHPEESYSNRFAEINANLAIIRAEIKLKGIASPAVVAAKLLAVDEQLLHWKQTLPESWNYTKCRAPGMEKYSPHMWQLRYDAYQDFWAAAVLNSYRCVRLIVHEAIVKAIIADGSGDNQKLFDGSVAALRETTDDVCSSVPYLLGYRPPNAQNIQTEDQVQPHPVPSPGGYVLLWPLFLSAMTRTTASDQRNWAAGMLRHIGLTMGLKLAISMATTLAQSNKTLSDGESWLNGDFCP